MLNDTEVGIKALTERAQRARRLAPGHTIACPEDARDYVDVAEAEGLTFVGRELLGV
jgi:hypothetical protein